MARHYHVDIAVFAAEADRKWVDNLLSHFDVPGVESARQGVARRVSREGVYRIVLVRRLTQATGMSAVAALTFAERLLDSPEGRAPLADPLELRIDLPAFRRDVDGRIADAVESVVPRKRGRPPGRDRG